MRNVTFDCKERKNKAQISQVRLLYTANLLFQELILLMLNLVNGLVK